MSYKIDSATLANWEVFYSYTQASSTSSTVTLDIPIDLVTYNRIIIEGACEPSSGTTSAAITPRDSSKGTITTHQFGLECWQGTFNNINRSSTELVAYGQDGSNSSHFKVEIFRANTINYPSFIAHSFGGGSTSRIMAQNFQGRIAAGPSAIKYIRCVMSQPQANSWVKAYRLKQ